MVENRADAVPESCVPEKYTGTTKQPSRILYHEHDVHAGMIFLTCTHLTIVDQTIRNRAVALYR